MSGYYAQDKEAALKQALELIPNGSTIAMGGCMSAHEIGLVKALQDGDYNYIDRAKLEPREGLMAAYDVTISFYPVPMQSQMMASFVNIEWQFQPCILHCPGSEKSNLYCRYKQSLSGS